MGISSLKLRFLAGLVLLLTLAPYCESKPEFYSVGETDGVWWFVDPQGKPFYSLGVCDIGPGPPRARYDPARPCYAAFRHYKSNKEWADRTLQRLADWNFNTVGGWADEELTHGPLPYAIVLHMGSQVGFPWNDVFAADFVQTLDRFARLRVKPRSGDTQLLGWYSDNEQGWYPDSLFAYHLDQPAKSKTRSLLIKLLADEYKNDFAALSRDFEVVSAKSFADLSRGGQLKLRPESGGRRVILKFTAAIAERYYKTVHDVIRRYDPNHLILGDRYARHCPDVVAKAAGPYVDVISTNLDWPEATDGYLPAGYLSNLHRISGRPVLITEYYVAARENRSGNKNSGNIFLTVETQDDRTAAVETRLRGLAEQPYVIGAHWFRFADEPTHGRSDGEDYNFGLVDIEDRPYEGLTAALVKLNSEVPAIHRASSPANAKSTIEINIPHQPADVVDMRTRLAQAEKLAIEDDSLQVYDVLSTWTESKIYVVALLNCVAQRETYSTKGKQADHQLELAIMSPGFNRPLAVRVPSADGASQLGDAECHLSTNGMHQTLVVAIPAKMFGKDAFTLNDQVQLKIAVKDLLNQTTAASEVRLRLAEGAVLGAKSPEAAAGGE